MSCALAGAVLRRLGYDAPQLVRDAANLSQVLRRGDVDVLLIDPALPSLDVPTLEALRGDVEGPATAAPIWVALVDGTATPSLPIALRKPLQREAVQAVLEALDYQAETWNDLIRLFGPAGVREMLDALKGDLRVQHEVLAQNPTDPAKLRGIAHRLRGAALQLGAHNLASHSARAEQLASMSSGADANVDVDVDVDVDAMQTRSRLLRMLERFDTLVGYLERQLDS